MNDKAMARLLTWALHWVTYGPQLERGPHLLVYFSFFYFEMNDFVSCFVRSFPYSCHSIDFPFEYSCNRG